MEPPTHPPPKGFHGRDILSGSINLLRYFFLTVSIYIRKLTPRLELLKRWLGKLTSIAHSLSAGKKGDFSRNADTIGEMIALLIGPGESPDIRKQNVFGLFILDVSCVQVARLGGNIPDWSERLCADVLADAFDQQMAKKNYRLLFTKIPTDCSPVEIDIRDKLPV